jgi:alanyl-tRNA synthetase
MEVWNNVFTQFEGDGKGGYEELSQKNIDTGMGLERLAVVMQDVDSVFDIDTMKAIRDRICELSGKTYQTDALDDVSIRLITDHIRSSTFLVSDGVMPSNEGRGYVLRRLIRRAARHGRMLGIDGLFLARLSETVIAESKDGYPELEEKKDFIFKVLTQEEEKFNKTIDQGLAILGDFMKQMKEQGSRELSGADTFKLYDTYGFPVDLTEEILEEQGFSYNEADFRACMEEQRQKARSARKETNYMGADATVYEQIDPAITSEFVGYDNLTYSSVVSVMTTETELVPALSDGDHGTIIVDQTPFYATMGGQQGDKGVIRTDSGTFIVDDTVKLLGGKYGHIGHMESGMIRVGEKVELVVDKKLRQQTCENHSATHLLQKALREVLGTHVEQAGSYQDSERTRFDFTHFAAMTPEEIARVEEIVNSKINESLEVRTDIMTVDEAKKTGAMALFGEKYGEKVRVVSMGEFSKEFCGGTHVKNTADIKVFKILSESGVAAGVRRIEALTGNNVLAYYRHMEENFAEAAKVVKATPANLVERLEHLTAELKALQSENESLKSKAAKDALGDVMDQVKEVKDIKLLATSVTGVDMNGLRDLGDQLKDKLGEGVVVIASDCDGKVNLIVMATDGAIKQGAHAGNLIKAIAGKVGGGGGGRPNMAQAGGKNPAGIPEAIAEAEKVLADMLA